MAVATEASEITDGALLKQLTAGDKAAWDSLVRRHADIVFSVVMRMVRNPADAEDAGQEAFLRIKEYAHTFDAARFGPSAKNWIATIACREALKINARKAGSKNVPFDDDMGGGEPQGEKKDKTGPARVEEQEIHALLRDAVQNLPQRQREVIVMHFAAGMTQTEIATELGCDQSTISDRIKQALDKLRHRMGAAGASMAIGPALLAASLTQAAPQAFVQALLNHASWAPAAVAAAKAAKAGAGFGAAKIAMWFGICAIAAAATIATVKVLKPKAPTPAEFGGFEDNTFQGWVANDGTKLEVVEEHAADGKRSLKADLSAGGYPGIRKVFDKPQDWSGYRAVRASVFSSADGPLNLCVRMDDDQSTGFGKRFNGDDACRIYPGQNEAEIPIGALWQGSLLARGINPARITALHYFVSGSKKPVTLWFDNIHLIEASKDAPVEVDLANLSASKMHIDPGSGATIEKASYKDGQAALKVTLPPNATYPSVAFYPPADWLPYDELTMDLAVEGKPPKGGLSLKVADVTGKNQTLNAPIGPGESTWAVPVEMFSQTALGRVKTFEIFGAEPQDAPRTIWIRSLKLKRFKITDGATQHAATARDPLTLDFTPMRPQLTANSFQALLWIPLLDGKVHAVRCNGEGRGPSAYSLPPAELLGRDTQKPLRIWAYYTDHGVCFWSYQAYTLKNEANEQITFDSNNFLPH
jgi:RNA polymerase sigma-70 factor (ECF subfamily)